MATLPPAGYSGKPLASKLGIQPGHVLLLIDAPPDHLTRLAPLPADVRVVSVAGPQVDLAQVFVTQKEALAGHLAALRTVLRPDAALWVSWPKKASGWPSTVTEDTVRELALPLGWVDVKVCAVSEVWSGLKLVVRKALR